MSCAIGLVTKDGIWIGTDSAATTNEGEKRPIEVEKVFRKGNFLIAYIGSVRGGQIVNSKDFKCPTDIFKLPDAIMELCREKGCLAINPEDQTNSHLCNYLVACKSGLYEILVDFQMNRISNYTAIGSGTSYAFGSLFTTSKSKNLTPEQKVKLALSAASFFDTSSAPPFIIEKF